MAAADLMVGESKDPTERFGTPGRISLPSHAGVNAGSYSLGLCKIGELCEIFCSIFYIIIYP